MLNALIFEQKKIRTKISEKLIDYLKTDSRFFCGVHGVQRLVFKNQDYESKIISELSTLCESIYSLTIEDIKLALSFQKEYNIAELESLDLAIATKTCDMFFGWNENLENQKLIRFIRFASKSEMDSF